MLNIHGNFNKWKLTFYYFVFGLKFDDKPGESLSAGPKTCTLKHEQHKLYNKLMKIKEVFKKKYIFKNTSRLLGYTLKNV